MTCTDFLSVLDQGGAYDDPEEYRSDVATHLDACAACRGRLQDAFVMQTRDAQRQTNLPLPAALKDRLAALSLPAP